MALFQTLTDTFISGYDATKWTGQYGTLSYTSGMFNITNPAGYTGYGGMQSLTTYDLTSSYSYVNITNVGNTALTSLEIYMTLQLNATNGILVIVSGGNYLFRKKVAGVNTDNFTGISATANPWIRLREATGTTYFDYSTNGTTWTNAASFLNPFAVTALTVFLSAGTYNAEATATTVSFDNYNITPTLSTLTKTQPAITRISNRLVKTQSSISRVIAIVTKTQSSIARITFSATKLQSSTARIALTGTPHTNIAQTTESIASWSSNGGTAVDNQYISPNGLLNATQISTSVSGAGRYTTYSGLTVGQTYTISVYMKYVSGVSIWYIGTDVFYVQVDLSNGTKIGTIGTAISNVYAVGNGWYRLSVSFAATVTNHAFVIYQASVGTSVVSAWGAQYEVSASPNSYIANTGTTPVTFIGAKIPSISRISGSPFKTIVATSHITSSVIKTQTGTATVVRSGQVLTHHDYKIYDGNTFLGLLPNVTSNFAYSQDINTVGSQITVEVAVSADTSFLPSTSTIDTELSAPIQDETGDNLLTEGAANIVGVGLGQSLIKNGNTVVVIEYNRFYPNGKIMFTGQIGRWDSSFGGSSGGDTISVLVYSSGQDTDNYIISTGSIPVATQSSDTATVTGANYGSAFAQSLKPASNINIGQLSVIASVPTGSPVSVFFKLYAGDPSLDYITTISGVTTYTVGGSNTLIDTSSTTLVTSLTPSSYTFTLATNHLLVSPNTYYFVAFFSAYSGYNIVFETATTGFTLTAPIDRLYYARGTTNNVGTSLSYDTAHPVMTVQILTIGGNTTSTYTTADPTTFMLKSILDNYKAQGGLLTYNTSSIDSTGLSLTYTFNTATVYEGVQAVLSLAPNGFYYYADLGSGVVYFKQSSAVADILITKNRDIDTLTIVATIENIANTILVSGGIPSGSTTNIYSQYKDSASIAKYGQRLKRISDNRITLQATANAVGNSALAQNKDERYQTTVTILNNMMNLTLLKPGQIIGFRGYGNFVDGLLAQIVRVDYTHESASLTLGILPKRIVPEFEKITRGLIAQQTIANPTAPS